MTSVVIAAHDEGAVIGRTLDALQTQGVALQVVVVANACTDDTVTVARAHTVDVIDLPEPGKAGALNAGDELARGFPRVFLDADIRLPPGALRAFSTALDGPGRPLAVAPSRVLETRGRPLLVRAYSAISARLPAYRDGLFGRGVVAMSATGRARFERFPAQVADDLFLDGLFSTVERRILEDVTVVVEAPWTTEDLLRRLVRVRRANSDLRAAAAAGDVVSDVRRSDRWAWLTEVVLPRPWLFPAGVVYVAVTLLAGIRGRRAGTPAGWERDQSTRTTRDDAAATSA